MIAGSIIVISGPSGVGKSTVVARVLELMPGLERSISLTTRGKRGREQEGREYFFVSRDEFIRRRDEGELLEWAEVHGNMYGTSGRFVERKISAGKNVVLEIDVQGGLQVRAKKPGAVMIFILPPSWKELEKRLRGRETDDEDTISRRLENARQELELGKEYGHQVVNDDLDTCVSEVVSIIKRL